MRTVGRAAAGNRACCCTSEDAFPRCSPYQAERELERADRRSQGPPCPPADTAQHDRVELQPPRRGGETAVQADGAFQWRAERGSGRRSVQLRWPAKRAGHRRIRGGKLTVEQEPAEGGRGGRGRASVLDVGDDTRVREREV